MNWVLLNGELVPEERAVVSIFDRGFLYGDGLFETMRVAAGTPFRWEQHIERLHDGAQFLKLRFPFAPEELRRFAGQLIERNAMPQSVLRIALSRGVGTRGYSPKDADRPTLVLSLHPSPPDADRPRQLRLVTSSFRIAANDPLTRFKTANKLPHILARAQADENGADDALLFNTAGQVAEATASNVFWLEKETVCTPPLECGALAGVTRGLVLELCQTIHVVSRQAPLTTHELRQADGVFLTNSGIGIAEAVELDGQLLKQSPLVRKLQAAYLEILRKECSGH